MNNSSVSASAPAMNTEWPTSDELDAAVDGFFESTFGAHWDIWDTSDLVDHIAWFAGTTGHGNMYDWDAERVVDFLTHVPTAVHLVDPGRAAMFPALLRGWVRFAGAEDGTPAIEVRRCLAAIEHAEPPFFGSIAEALAGDSLVEA